MQLSVMAMQHGVTDSWDRRVPGAVEMGNSMGASKEVATGSEGGDGGLCQWV